MDEIKKPPTPGTTEAVEQGCTCPVMDNNHGQFKPWPGNWWVTQGCPLHDPPPPVAA